MEKISIKNNMAQHKNIKVAFIIPYFSEEPSGRYAVMHDIIHSLKIMKNPPFEFRVISFTGDNTDKNPGKKGKEKGLKPFLQKVSEIRCARNEGYLLHSIHGGPKCFLVSLFLSICRKTPLIVGPNIGGAYPPRNIYKPDTYSRKVDFLRKKLFFSKHSLLSKKIKKILAFTKWHKELYLSANFDPGKIEILENTVREDIFYPVKKAVTKTLKILFVGGPELTRKKGFDLFVGALKELKKREIKFRASVCGSKSSIKNIDLSGLKEGEEIIYLGVIERKLIADVYRNADVLIMGSSDELSPPTISIESRSCGTPVIGSDIPPTEGVNTLTYKKCELMDLVDKILHFIENKERIINNAYKEAGNFKVEKSINKLAEIYSAVV
jgi:glycosyltransferase involved in cell wall biosynthesis